MGFFKLFSIGSKKNKKKKIAATAIRISEPFAPVHHRPQEDQDAAFARLLRSSSAHFKVVSEVDHALLPPIPHPINTVSSRTSLASRAPSVQTKSSFVVTLLGRKTHSRTEFPNANPPITPPDRNGAHDPHNDDAHNRRLLDPRKIPITPRDRSRLVGLRQDPSVLSLLDMYDAHGCLDEKAFSNTPRRQNSRRSTKRDSRPVRRQSTLRELMGGNSDKSDSPQADPDGDISWAEQFLDEANRSNSSVVTTSSLGLETPTAALFKSDIPFHDHPDMTMLVNDLSLDSTSAYPLFSSMEVEVSVIMDPDDLTFSESPKEGRAQFARTPSQRASQVFGFLSEKRQGKRPQKQQEENGRPLPALPTANRNKRSNDSNSLWIDDVDDTHADFSPILDVFPAAPLSNHQLQALALPAPPSPFVFQPLQPPPTRMKSVSMGAADLLKTSRRAEPKTKAIAMSTAPEVIAQATNPSGQLRGPRGPRPRNSTDLEGVVQREEPTQNGARRALGEISNSRAFDKGKGKESSTRSFIPTAKGKPTPVAPEQDDHFTPIPPRLSNRRISSKAVDVDTHKQAIVNAYDDAKTGKENTKRSSVIRSNTTGPLMLQTIKPSPHSPSSPSRTPVRNRTLNIPLHLNTFPQAPSPASSSELSPAAKQMMTDLRARKSRVKEALAKRSKRIRAGI